MSLPTPLGDLPNPRKRLQTPPTVDSTSKKRVSDDFGKANKTNGSIFNTNFEQNKTNPTTSYYQPQTFQYDAVPSLHPYRSTATAQMSHDKSYSSETVEFTIETTWNLSFKGSHSALISLLNSLPEINDCFSAPENRNI